MFFFSQNQHQSDHKKVLSDFMELQQKHVNANEQLSKLFKENAEMISLLKDKEQVSWDFMGFNFEILLDFYVFFKRR